MNLPGPPKSALLGPSGLPPTTLPDGSTIVRLRPISSRKFSCTTCGSRFERRGHLDAHQTSVHEGKRPYDCPHGCGKAYGHQSSLSRHIKTAHQTSFSPPPPGASSSNHPSGQSSRAPDPS